MKKMRIACFLLAGLTALESAVLPVQASSVEDEIPTGFVYRMQSDPEDSTWMLSHHTYNGRPAYCIEPRVPVGDGEVYAEGSLNDWTGVSQETKETVLLASVFGEGYQGRKGDLWYTAAQDIIWEAVGDPVVWKENDKVKKAAAEIRATMEEYRKKPDFHITDTVTDQEVGAGGVLKYGTAGRVYKVEDKAGLITGMHAEKTEGLHLLDENEKEINPADLQSSAFLVRNDQAGTEESVSFTGMAGTNRFKNIPIILYGNELEPEAQKHIVTGSLNPIVHKVTIATEEEPFRLRKTDENGKGMKGAVLSLEKDGKVIDAWTSDGQVHEVKLEKDAVYQIHETDAPDGYYCKDFSFTADEAHHHDAVDLSNDEKIRYEVLKTDEDDQPVTGARLALYDVTDGSARLVKMNDEKGNPWLTDGKPRDISAYLHASHSYSVVEEDVSTAYFLAENTEFSVSSHAPEGNPVKTVKMTDNHIVYRFAKLDGNGKPVENAELRIYDLDDHEKEVSCFTTGTLPETVTVLKRGHQYLLRETMTPQGRYTMEEKKFTVPAYHNAEPITITGIDYDIVYYADKTDENEKPVSGASMEVRDVTNGADRLVSAFVTDDQPHRLQNLTAGHQYILRETASPQGYFLAEDVHFQVPEKGNGEPVHVSVIDHPVHLPVRKTDPDGNRLAGVRLEVIDRESGDALGSWQTSKDADIEIGSLVQAGREYILRETEGINGYWQHPDITFSVPQKYTEGMDISVVMEDQPMRIQVLKEDESSHPLADAHITLREKETDKIVHEWDSVLEPEDISACVHPGGTYVLKETEIVAGHYEAAEKEFTVDLYPAEGNPVIVLKMVDETIHYEIAKVNEEGHPVAGVHLKLTDMQSGETAAEWDTDENAYELTGVLNAGVTYLLEETEWKNGVMQAQDMQFTVPWQGTSAPVHIQMVDETVALSFLKTDEEGKPLAGAVLSILDTEGQEICSFTSTEDPHGVSVLADGRSLSELLKGGSTYVLHEKQAPFGYALASDVNFTVEGTLARPQLIALTDHKETVYLHLIKADAAHPEKKLADARLAVYRNSDQTIAKDMDGQDAVVTTDENGDAWVSLIYDPDGYCVREVEAPEGYQLTSEVYEADLTHGQGFSKDNPVVLEILNDQEVRTGTGLSPELLGGISFLILSLGLLVYRRYRKV